MVGTRRNRRRGTAGCDGADEEVLKSRGGWGRGREEPARACVSRLFSFRPVARGAPITAVVELSTSDDYYYSRTTDGGLPVLRIMLEGAWYKLTRSNILEEWSSDYPKPHPGTLARWLDRAVERGLVKREGAGRKSNPFYYWLPEREGKLLGGCVWM